MDIIVDQWDLALGQDVSLFMQRGVASSDRAIMVCSEEYVKKADNGAGGVGYEVFIPLSSYDKLPPQGNEVKLLTYQHFGSQDGTQQLFGFATTEERETPRDYSNRESHWVWGRRYLLAMEPVRRGASSRRLRTGEMSGRRSCTPTAAG